MIMDPIVEDQSTPSSSSSWIEVLHMQSLLDFIHRFSSAFVYDVRNLGLVLAITVLSVMVAQRIERKRVEHLMIDAERANAKLLREMQQINQERAQLLQQIHDQEDRDDERDRKASEDGEIRRGVPSVSTTSTNDEPVIIDPTGATVALQANNIMEDNEPSEVIIHESSNHGLTSEQELASHATHDVDASVAARSSSVDEFTQNPSVSSAMNLLVKGIGSMEAAENVLPDLLEFLLAKRRADVEKAATKALERNDFDELNEVCNLSCPCESKDTPNLVRVRARLQAMSIERDLRTAIEDRNEDSLTKSLQEAEAFNRDSKYEQVPPETIHLAESTLLMVSTKLDAVLQSAEASGQATSCDKLSAALSEEMWNWQPTVASSPSPSSPSGNEICDEQEHDSTTDTYESPRHALPSKRKEDPIEHGLHLLAKLQTQKELDEAIASEDVDRVRTSLSVARVRGVQDELAKYLPAAEWIRLKDCSANLNESLSLSLRGSSPSDMAAYCSAVEDAIQNCANELVNVGSYFESNNEPTIKDLVDMERSRIQPLLRTAQQRLHQMRMHMKLSAALAHPHENMSLMKQLILEYRELCNQGWLSLSDRMYQRCVAALKRQVAIQVLVDSSSESPNGDQLEEKCVVCKKEECDEEKNQHPSPAPAHFTIDARDTLKAKLVSTAAAMEFAEEVCPDFVTGSAELYESVRNLHLVILEAYLNDAFELDGPKCLATLIDLGIDRVDDLRMVTEGDLRQCGVSRLLAKKITPRLVELGEHSQKEVERLTNKINEERLV